MKQITTAVFLLLLLIGCTTKQDKEQQAGTAARTTFAEVIDSQHGYIIESASIVVGNSPDAFAISQAVRLAPGKSSVLIVRTSPNDSSDETLLALQFPAFASGSAVEYTGKPEAAQFWIIGTKDGNKTAISTGLISGSLRFIKSGKSAANLGLNRELLEGTGEMEIVVSNISTGALKALPEKKYAAQFILPIITLEELMKINQPA